MSRTELLKVLNSGLGANADLKEVQDDFNKQLKEIQSNVDEMLNDINDKLVQTMSRYSESLHLLSECITTVYEKAEENKDKEVVDTFESMTEKVEKAFTNYETMNDVWPGIFLERTDKDDESQI